MSDPIKVAIDAAIIPDGHEGGVEQFITGLVHSLGRLNDPSFEYIIVGSWQNPRWLEPHLGPNQRILPIPTPPQEASAYHRLLRKLYRRRKRCSNQALPAPAGRWIDRLLAQADYTSVLNDFYDKLKADVVHFPHQNTRHQVRVTVFNPHDLQHLHFPEFFTHQQIQLRETVYRRACRHARAIVAESLWVKNDLIRNYAVGPEKIFVVYRGSPTEWYGDVTEAVVRKLKEKYDLDQPFALYPAQTWPHKNHLRLLAAIHRLNALHGIRLKLVCTGKKNDFWPAIADRTRDLGLQNQVVFTGYILSEELKALYRLAQFVVVPSLCEGGGFPVLEGFHQGTPVTCADTTALPEYGGDAVLLFDPQSVDSMAAALHRMATDRQLLTELAQKGRVRIRRFSWKNTAEAYQALYKQVAGRPLVDEECHILEQCTH